MKITFIFSCSGMFRNVPACSGMFRVPGFIDAFHSYQFSSQMITTQFTAIYKKSCSTGPFLFFTMVENASKKWEKIFFEEFVFVFHIKTKK